jgi:hypothetical protein
MTVVIVNKYNMLVIDLCGLDQDETQTQEPTLYSVNVDQQLDVKSQRGELVIC